MKIKTKITALLASLTFLASCKESEEYGYHHTVGEENNAITLMAGISEGGAKLQTRAVDGNHDADDTYGGGHKAFSTTNNTELRLRVDGTWLSKGFTNNLVSKQTTATTGSVPGTENEHNELSFSPQLYWDDYGTADPANIDSPKGNAASNEGGRGKGLTIYGVAVNEKTLPTQEVDSRSILNVVSDWTNIAWNVGDGASGTIDQSTTNGWGDYDLLISNNVKTDKDGTLKFDDLYPTKLSTASDLLEFTHAMSKITFVLSAGDGFPEENSVHKFDNTPEVTLTSRVTGDNSTEEWVQTKGSVNVETGSVTLASTPVKASIKMHHAGTDATTKKVTLDALVFPGSEFKDASEPAKYPVIARIKADDNIYYITTKKIRSAISTAYSAGKHGSNYVTEPGKNYIFNVTINKTKIEVTATITDWIDVKAETVTPVINVSGQVGDKGATNGSLSAFNFYMRENTAATYTAYGKAEGTADGSTAWQFKDASNNNTTLYWPTHNTHYHMRGVSPTTTTIDANKQIVVSNAQYNASTSPSNLMIGAPEIADGDKMCNNSDHTSVDMTQNGICARNNTINLNFRYVMSQVEVKLKSTGTVGKDLVDFTSGVKVDIVGGYDKARIQLDTRLHDTYTNSDKPNEGKYVMNARSLTSDETTNGVIKSAMHDIIVPQTLTDDMKFRITVTNSDGTTDVYETQLNEIYAIVDNTKTNKIAEWESGKHYIYELDIKKTEIKVTATITPWTEVTANQPVWF